MLSMEDDDEGARLAKMQDESFMNKFSDPCYLTFLLMGMGLLWPWNCILSASAYIKSEILDANTIWSRIFTSSMMSVSTVASLSFNLWLCKRQFAYSQRVLRGLMWEILAFTALILICLFHGIFSSGINFVLIMILVLVSALGTAMTQNGILAISNVYGSIYTQAIMLGQAIAGVFPSTVLLMISIFSKLDSQSLVGIILYFATTIAMSVLCIHLYHRNQIDRVLKSDIDDTFDIDESKSTIPFTVMFSHLKYLVLSIFTTFTVTMVFAVFASTVMPKGLPMSSSQFVPLIFTVWNLGDLCGRFIADMTIFQHPMFTHFKVFLASLLRIGLLPMFFAFLQTPIKMKVTTDLLYILLQFIFGLTNGHVISLSFIKVPQALHTDEEKEAAGGFTNVFVSTGLALGSILSYAFVYLIDRVKT